METFMYVLLGILAAIAFGVALKIAAVIRSLLTHVELTYFLDNKQISQEKETHYHFKSMVRFGVESFARHLDTDAVLEGKPRKERLEGRVVRLTWPVRLQGEGPDRTLVVERRPTRRPSTKL